MENSFFEVLKKNNFFFHLISILAAIALYFIIQPHNVGFSPDSMAYLEVAENILKGNGVVNREGDIVDHWPPLFPLAIALTSKVSGIAVICAGIILQPVLLYFFVLLFLFILKGLRVNYKITWITGILIIVSQVTKNFLWYLSEGLFFVLLLVSFFFILKWLDRKKPKYLIMAGVFCGFLFLSRYAGVGFIGAYVLFLVFQKRNRIKENFKDVFTLLLPVFLIISPWFFYIKSLSENPQGRQVEVHLVPFSKLYDLLKTFGFWLIGSSVARLTFLVIVVSYFLIFFRRKEYVNQILQKMSKKYGWFVKLCLLLSLTYIIFLLVSISFMDSRIPLNNRILSPILLFTLLIVAIFLQSLYEKKAISLLIGTCSFLILSFISSTFSSFELHYIRGSGYTSTKWSHSETLLKWKQKKNVLPIYTNGVELGVLYLGEKSILLPMKNKEIEIEQLIKKVKAGEAEIVIFNEINWRNYLVGQQRLLEDTKEEGIQQIFLEDGLILRATSE